MSIHVIKNKETSAPELNVQQHQNCIEFLKIKLTIIEYTHEIYLW